MHYGNTLYYGHYVIDCLDAKTGIWWHCDDKNITKISDFQKLYKLESVTKKN